MTQAEHNPSTSERAPASATCAAVSEALASEPPRAGSPEHTALRAHARACPACAALLAHDEALRASLAHGASPDAGSPEALPPALAEALARDHAPVTRRSLLRRVAPPFVLGLGLSVAALSVSPRCDLTRQHRENGLFDTTLALLAAGTVAALLLVFVRGRDSLGTSPRLRVGTVIAGVIGFVALAAAATHPVPGSLHFHGATAWLYHALCFTLGTIVSAIVCVVGARAAQHTEVRSPATAGLALGLAGGLTGAIVLQFQCAFADPMHYALGHGAAVFAGPVVGALWARRKLAV